MAGSSLNLLPREWLKKLGFPVTATSDSISILKRLRELLRPTRPSIATLIPIAVSLMSLSVQSANSQTRTIAERLGYPPDSKLLIIHADDLAVAHSVDHASWAALQKNSVTSASAMVPCPWLTEVVEIYKQHPTMDLGLHLTLNSEWKTYRWGPVAPWNQVPGLLSPDGYMWVDQASVWRHARPEEVDHEIRSQIQRAIRLGIRPTHLDSHMATLLHPEYFSVLVKVAHEYGLPFLVSKDMDPQLLKFLSPDDIVLDSRPRLALKPPSPGQPDNSELEYLTVLRAIKPGVHQIIVHLGYDDSELRSIMTDHPEFGAAWRQRDFDIVNSARFKHALMENHIRLINWRQLSTLVRR